MAQTFQGRHLSQGDTVDYTPGSDVASGDVVEQGVLLGVAINAIAANRLGALAVHGVFDVVKITGAMAAGVKLYWDNNGNPLGGAALSGCATTVAAGNVYMGVAVLAAGAGDEYVTMLLTPSN